MNVFGESDKKQRNEHMRVYRANRQRRWLKQEQDIEYLKKRVDEILFVLEWIQSALKRHMD